MEIGNGDKIFLRLNSKVGKNRLFCKKVKEILAGPCAPSYKIKIAFYEDGAFEITGNQKEIQWLHDELIEWSGVPIKYKEFTLKKIFLGKLI